MVDRPSSPENVEFHEQRVVIIMGSENDLAHCIKISEVLKEFKVNHDLRVASAHRTPNYVGEVIDEYSQDARQIVFIAVAGRSNGLGGASDYHTPFPVISSPLYSDKFGGADVFSSIRMPSESAAVLASEPEMAALHAIKIFALNNPRLHNEYISKLLEMKGKIMNADQKVREEYSVTF